MKTLESIRQIKARSLYDFYDCYRIKRNSIQKAVIQHSPGRVVMKTYEHGKMAELIYPMEFGTKYQIFRDMEKREAWLDPGRFAYLYTFELEDANEQEFDKISKFIVDDVKRKLCVEIPIYSDFGRNFCFSCNIHIDERNKRFRIASIAGQLDGAISAAHDEIHCILLALFRNTDVPVFSPIKGYYTGCKHYDQMSTASNAPYYPFIGEAKNYIVTAAQLPKDAEIFHLACKGGYTVAFGTSQKIRMSGSGKDRKWSASGGWMHAMAAYGYDAATDSVGIDNSHGDGFAWADQSVLKMVVDRAKYFDGFVILDIKPRPGRENWNPIGQR